MAKFGLIQSQELPGLSCGYKVILYCFLCPIAGAGWELDQPGVTPMPICDTDATDRGLGCYSTEPDPTLLFDL